MRLRPKLAFRQLGFREPRAHLFSWLGTIFVGAIVSANYLRAQEIGQGSISGESAAEGEHKTSDGQPYNLHLGPVNLRIDASISTSYNDNINLANSGRLSDFIITPSVNLHLSWQATELNDLTLDLGLGYQKFLAHSQYSSQSVLLSPNSQLQFNIYVSDFKFNVYDRFSYQQDPTQVGQLSNVAQFSRLLNDVGVQADWDLGDLTATLGYDHNNTWVFQSAFSYLDSQSNAVSPKITFRINPTLRAGFETSVTQTQFDKRVQNNSTGLTGGPFVNVQLTDNLVFQAQAGWNYTDFSRGGLNGDTENINSYYVSAGGNHRISDSLSESVTMGRETEPGLTTNFTQRVYANYSPSWQIMPSLKLSPYFWWENLDDSDGKIRQTANRFGASINVDYQVAEHLTLNLGYQYVLKKASPANLNYDQNVLTLGLKYQF